MIALSTLISAARRHLPDAEDIRVSASESIVKPGFWKLSARCRGTAVWQVFHESELALAAKVVASKLGIGWNP